MVIFTGALNKVVTMLKYSLTFGFNVLNTFFLKIYIWLVFIAQ